MTHNPRHAKITRETRETNISAELVLDGRGACEVSTGIGFLDHMLAQLAHHSGLSLRLSCQGDLHVDGHHTVEDVGIVLGMALKQALGDCAGIQRYGHAIVPMDESLVLCAVDISGRGLSVVDLPLPVERVGTLDAELVPEFFRAFAAHAGLTLHIRLITGANGHHIVEAAFKALARALGEAVALVAGREGVPSTKGVL